MSLDVRHPQALTEGSEILAAHRAAAKRRLVILIGLSIVVLGSFVLDVITGSADLTLRRLIEALLLPSSVDLTTQVIVWDIRLVFAVMAVLVGASLALSGAEMQTVLDNPLASPFTLGISSAAAFGAALVIIGGIGLPFLPATWQLPVNAFVAAASATGGIYLFARYAGLGATTLILFGVAIMFAFNAGLALLQFVASPQALQELLFWTLGGLSRSDWTKAAVLAAVLAATAPFALNASSRYNALRLGEDRARSFGVDVDWLRLAALLRVSLLTATAVSFVGTIAFIGLVAPHIARMLIGEDHRYLLPASMLTGSFLMSTASIVSKLIVPGGVAPVGVVTSVIGVPLFVVLILAQRRRQ